MTWTDLRLDSCLILGSRRRISATGCRAPAGSGHAPPGARGASHELGGEDHPPLDGVAAFDLVDQEPGHLVAHLLDRLADAGESWSERRGDWRVVIADDGDVLRNLPA